MIPRKPGPVHEGKNLTSFTPTWTASGTAPAIGDGTLTGLYSVRDYEVFVVINFVAGSTTTFGTGQWIFALPIAGNASVVQCLVGYAFNNTGAYYPAIGSVNGTAFVTGTVGSIGELIDVDSPFTWGTSDALYISGTYLSA